MAVCIIKIIDLILLGVWRAVLVSYINVRVRQRMEAGGGLSTRSLIRLTRAAAEIAAICNLKEREIEKYLNSCAAQNDIM